MAVAMEASKAPITSHSVARINTISTTLNWAQRIASLLGNRMQCYVIPAPATITIIPDYATITESNGLGDLDRMVSAMDRIGE